MSSFILTFLRSNYNDEDYEVASKTPGLVQMFKTQRVFENQLKEKEFIYFVYQVPKFNIFWVLKSWWI